MHLKHLLTRPLVNVPRWVVIVMLAIAIIGFADATYLTLEHYRGVIPPCTISGCEIVLTSQFSTLFGIPTALLGAIYYLIMSVGLFAYLDTKKEPILKSVVLFSAFGFLFSVWFFYLQAFVIHSFCQYCLVSATTSTLLFIFSKIVFWKYRSIHENI